VARLPLTVKKTDLKLRSARCQCAYWDNGQLRIANYLTRESFAANPVTLEVIGFFFTPRTIREALLKFDGYAPESVGEVILKLMKAELLLRCGSAEAARDEYLDSSWREWLPEGGFHFLTKDAPYTKGDVTVEEQMRPLTDAPQPPHFKKTARNRAIVLPKLVMASDIFFETLRARRTQRKFSRAKVPIQVISSLLEATWGVQGYLQSEYGPLPLKTSPSGGARHPIEVYLVALRVAGLKAGLYHYDPRGHALGLISHGASAKKARAYCADQPYVSGAAALFIMTAVFERTMWKYRHPRAYRVVLLDAGHLGQTFCLTATRMGLAAFTTAALKDTLIERDLGIDGICESVVYVTGVGISARKS
jgi:SagB-type dehydrogenase family enzyme